MIVVDASAVLESVAVDRPDPDLVSRLATEDLHAPHLIDVEVLHALRVLVTRDAITGERAEWARADYDALDLTRYPHVALRPRIWELRHNLSAYDAAYVALAEALETSLVTTDHRIERVPGLGAGIEVFPRGD